jgi:hypothetical protein
VNVSLRVGVRSAFLPVGSVVTWLLSALNMGLFHGNAKQLSTSIGTAFAVCLALNVWLIYCSIVYSDDQVRSIVCQEMLRDSALVCRPL